jgi:predicted dehydrogenase
MSANSNIVRVGIAGLGRSGWHIHADALATMPGSYKVVAVVDPSAERSREAVERFGCRAYESYEQFVIDPSIDMIIVATPSHLHVDHVLAALHAGKHVVCEKPMAGSLKEADRLIRAVEAQDRQVAIFHNRRFEPHYQKVSQVIGSGQLGRIVQARMMQHQFTRRWDWQTLREFNGGLINNIGSHLLDLLLQLFPMDRPRCFAHADAALTLGDTEDHCVLLFQQQGSPLLHVEITNVSAFDQDLWMIMGTKGTLRGNANEINWQVADPSSLPERHLERELKSNTRAYVRDDIRWIKHRWKTDTDSDLRYYPYEQFYLRMHAAVCHGGPSPVPPRSVRPLIAALEQAREQAEAGLLPLTLQARTTPDAKPAPKPGKASLTPIR